MDLNGKRALVTGGAVRIGRAITEALQKQGVEVVVHCRESLRQAEGLSPFVLQADLDAPGAGTELVARAIDDFGPLDILVNNAARFTKETLSASSAQSVLREFHANLFAPMDLIRAFAAQGGRGSVVNLLDRRIVCNDTSCAPYSLTKKALADLTRLVALEYAPRIAVNAVAPGAVLPPPGSPTANVRELAGRIPLEQLSTPGQVAEAAIFLLRAESITGQVVFVDGGQHLLGNGV